MQLNKSPHCLNCDTEVGDAKFCPQCGQLNSDRKISLRRLFGDFIGDYFSFDSRILHSLRPLLLKPGFLTHEYLAGRRTRYILPLRFYIFTAALLFLVLSLRSVSSIIEEDLVISLDDSTTAAVDTSGSSFSLSLPFKSPEDSGTSEDQVPVTGESIEDDPGGFDISLNKTDSSAHHTFFERKIAYLESLGEKGGGVLGKELLTQLPRILFLLLPLFAMILKLLYLRRRIYFVEHLVFALHFHIFVFLLLILIALLPYKYIVFALLTGGAVYLFQSLRLVYQQSKVVTAVKFVLLFVLYSLCLLPATLALIFLTIATV
ncbi:DUF3667 domain-containing protein [bacterium]|nr:DUF3667 domain-containing protein [bacterium]